jgi:hypothetical protein
VLNILEHEYLNPQSQLFNSTLKLGFYTKPRFKLFVITAYVTLNEF